MNHLQAQADSDEHHEASGDRCVSPRAYHKVPGHRLRRPVGCRARRTARERWLQASRPILVWRVRSEAVRPDQVAASTPARWWMTFLSAPMSRGRRASLTRGPGAARHLARGSCARSCDRDVVRWSVPPIGRRMRVRQRGIPAPRSRSCSRSSPRHGPRDQAQGRGALPRGQAEDGADGVKMYADRDYLQWSTHREPCPGSIVEIAGTRRAGSVGQRLQDALWPDCADAGDRVRRIAGRGRTMTRATTSDRGNGTGTSRTCAAR